MNLRVITAIGLLASCVFAQPEFADHDRPTVTALEVAFANAGDPMLEWQIHASWCTTDRGSSGFIYRHSNGDPFERAIACQRDAKNDRAANLIWAAGRPTVNNFLAGK
jgi:hypothetical protein